MHSSKTSHTVPALLLACTALAPASLLAQNNPPDAPTISEPARRDLVLNPADVHMETRPMTDPDPGQSHAGSDWEIWTVSPRQRVWIAADVTGPEKVHAHLGDGVFENSHAGQRRLLGDTAYEMRVRHRDDSGDPLTQWSPFTSITFSTGPISRKEPMLLDDIEDHPAPSWVDLNGVAVDLPSGTPNPSVRVETANGWLLLRIDGLAGPGNSVRNPAQLPVHQAVRVVIDSGSTNLALPATDLTGLEDACEVFTIKIPAVTLAPNQRTVFWVSEDGATYDGNASPTVPSFDTPARGIQPPWIAREPGYAVEVIADGLRMPVNIAFVPGAGTASSDPKFYVTELYGTIKVVAQDLTVSTYATGLVNYTPSGAFPGSGEQGLTGIAVDPVSKDVFVSHLWRTGSQNYPRITRLRSTDGGRTSSSRQVILDMLGEAQGQSHQISNLEIVGGQLYAHMGDGFDASTARNLRSYRGKILRLNLDGSPVSSNPLYDGGIRDARDYIYAYGVRNPFGGAWRAADNSRYFVENGPDVDRFAKLVAGRDYGWTGSNANMQLFALHNWSPSTGPVNIAFVQQQTFGGSGFPASRWDHAFVTESGPTYAEGEQERGKRITEFTLDVAGNVVTGPSSFVEYAGDGFATVVALSAGPDGLYFSEFYKDLNTTGPTAIGGRVLRIHYGDPQDCNANGDPDWCEIAIGAVADCNGNGVPDSCDIRDAVSLDLDANEVPDECQMLSASSGELSAATGGRIDFTLDAGAARAGMDYLLVGSASGTQPGTPLGQVLLPLNIVGDAWFAISAGSANSPNFPNTRGRFDAQGRSSAALVLSSLPSGAVGATLHHAYVVFDASLGIRAASNAMPLAIVQ